MFCTSKEQETCDVEKQGCEGCYYNISEEKTISILKKLNDDYEESLKNPMYLYPETIQVIKDRQRAICNIISLYQQKKETNKKLVDEIYADISKKIREFRELGWEDADIVEYYE